MIISLANFLGDKTVSPWTAAKIISLILKHFKNSKYHYIIDHNSIFLDVDEYQIKNVVYEPNCHPNNLFVDPEIIRDDIGMNSVQGAIYSIGIIFLFLLDPYFRTGQNAPSPVDWKRVYFYSRRYPLKNIESPWVKGDEDILKEVNSFIEKCIGEISGRYQTLHQLSVDIDRLLHKVKNNLICTLHLKIEQNVIDDINQKLRFEPETIATTMMPNENLDKIMEDTILKKEVLHVTGDVYDAPKYFQKATEHLSTAAIYIYLEDVYGSKRLKTIARKFGIWGLITEKYLGSIVGNEYDVNGLIKAVFSDNDLVVYINLENIDEADNLEAGAVVCRFVKTLKGIVPIILVGDYNLKTKPYTTEQKYQILLDSDLYIKQKPHRLKLSVDREIELSVMPSIARRRLLQAGLKVNEHELQEEYPYLLNCNYLNMFLVGANTECPLSDKKKIIYSYLQANEKIAQIFSYIAVTNRWSVQLNKWYSFTKNYPDADQNAIIVLNKIGKLTSEGTIVIIPQYREVAEILSSDYIISQIWNSVWYRNYDFIAEINHKWPVNFTINLLVQQAHLEDKFLYFLGAWANLRDEPLEIAYNLAEAFIHLGKVKKALKWLRLAARTGHAEAKYLLSIYYHNNQNFMAEYNLVKDALQCGYMRSRKRYEEIIYQRIFEESRIVKEGVDLNEE